MSIKIIKCSNTEKNSIEEWYKDKIGQEFDVEWSVENYHFVKFDNKKKGNFINKNDVE